MKRHHLDVCSVVLIVMVTGSVGSSALAAAAEDELTVQYRETAARIVGAALVDQEGWQKLEHLTTTIGARPSGSAALQAAIDWAARTMREEGLAVTLQPVLVPHWVRGEESLAVISPLPRRLPMLGLGGSVATPEAGIVAPVVVVGDWSELEALSREQVEGRIVVYAVDWEGYGQTVQYRGNGASRAAQKGAVAVLVRSATNRSLGTPHTGALRYAAEVAPIPAAAITVEDALWFRRMAERAQEVTVRLTMAAQTLPDAESANVIAEIRGRERPDEVVVIGGHFDSWDVGQGAHDDGAACVAAWQAVRLLSKLGLRPRRTLRAVLWTAEENGLAGANAYRAALGADATGHVAAIEMDGGVERPVGFGYGGYSDAPPSERALGLLRQIGALLDGLEAGEIAANGGGADIEPLMSDGVPGMALRTVGEHYFDWHHTDADTLDKIDSIDLRKATALFAVMGYVLADMEPTLRD